MNERIDNLNTKIWPSKKSKPSPFISENDYQDEQQEREFLQDDHTNYLATTSWRIIFQIFKEFLFGYDKSKIDCHGEIDHRHQFLMILKLILHEMLLM